MLRQIRVLAGSSSGTMRRVWAVINDDSIERIMPFMGTRQMQCSVSIPDGSGRAENIDLNYLRTRNGNEILMHPDDVRRFFPDLRVGDFTPEDLAREREEISNEEPEQEPTGQDDAESVSSGQSQSVPFQAEGVIGPSSQFAHRQPVSASAQPARGLDDDDEPF